jgi:transposase
VLYEAAHIMLRKPIKAVRIEEPAMRIARRAGMSNAKVALAQTRGDHASYLVVGQILFNAEAANPASAPPSS